MGIVFSVTLQNALGKVVIDLGEKGRPAPPGNNNIRVFSGMSPGGGARENIRDRSCIDAWRCNNYLYHVKIGNGTKHGK
jgi:hypothetical protein